MILDVVQSAAAEPVPWWMSATAPWWATPVATLAGALLAWLLARLTAGRAEKRAAQKEALEHRRAVYLDFWSAVLDHGSALAAGKNGTVLPAVANVVRALFPLELVAPDSVVKAARAVIETMKSETDGEAKGTATRALRAAMAKDLRSG